MTAELLFEKFDRVAEAPDAIRQVRRFILSLAVRGKVTERDPTDEPASQLLLEIERRRIESSRVARHRMTVAAIPPINLADVPFTVPDGWLWTRIRQVTQDRGQAIPTSEFTYIDVTAIDQEAGRIRDPVVLAASDAPSRARKIVKRGDVLYSCVRPYLLNIAIVEDAIEPPPIASTAFAVLDGLGLVAPRYLWTALRSPYFVECVQDKMRGQAYPAINDADFALLPVPLPPLAEQHRIVARVDELMALCDQLEAAQKDCDALRDELRSASLQRNSSKVDGPSRSGDLRFFLNNTPRLFTKPEHLVAVRQTILDLAVRGLLVPQDASEPPHRLARIGSSAAVPIDPALVLPFPVPPTWATVLVRDTLSADRDISYGIIKLGPEPKNGGIPTLRCSDVKSRTLDLRFVRTVAAAIERDYSRTRLRGGEIVINVRGTLGGVARIPEALTGYNVAREVAVVPIAGDIDADYLVDVMASPYFWDRIHDSLRGIAYLGLNLRTLRQLPVPLPPVAEQHRIVAKVDELMGICNELEVALTTAQSERGRLLEALLHEALNGIEPLVPAEVSAG